MEKRVCAGPRAAPSIRKRKKGTDGSHDEQSRQTPTFAAHAAEPAAAGVGGPPRRRPAPRHLRHRPLSPDARRRHRRRGRLRPAVRAGRLQRPLLRFPHPRGKRLPRQRHRPVFRRRQPLQPDRLPPSLPRRRPAPAARLRRRRAFGLSHQPLPCGRGRRSHRHHPRSAG